MKKILSFIYVLAVCSGLYGQTITFEADPIETASQALLKHAGFHAGKEDIQVTYRTDSLTGREIRIIQLTDTVSGEKIWMTDTLTHSYEHSCSHSCRHSFFHNDTVPVLIPLLQTKTVVSPEESLHNIVKGEVTPMLVSSFGSLHTHIPNSMAISTDKVVGEIPLQHQVTPTGATVYNIPVECLPGRHGAQPNISITYNSQGGGGVLGAGWCIGGLSAIARTPATYYHNGSVKPVAIWAVTTDDQFFVMDGVRLIPRSKSATMDTYEALQGNMRIEAFHYKNILAEVMQYFKVWYPDGSTAIYGYENNRVNKLVYPLTSFTDRLGNTVHYTYTEENGHYYIEKIEYGASKSYPGHFASLHFTYKTRTDVSTAYEAGLEITEDKLLEKIECKSGNSVLRTYTFTYTLNRESLLTQIDCSLASGNLSPLKFYYGTGSPQTQLVNTLSNIMAGFSNIKLVVSKGKIDMWSDDDALIVYPELNPYTEIFVPGGIFSHSKRYYQNMYHPDQELLIYPSIADGYVFPFRFTAGEGFIELTSGDLDGKPGDELIKINNTVSGSSDRLVFETYKPLSIGAYIRTGTYTFYPFNALDHYGTKSITPKAYCLGDFAGIGRMQMLTVSRYNPLGQDQTTKITVYDLTGSTGSTFYSSNTTGLELKVEENGADVLFGMDYDGDGRTDICHIHASGTDIYSFSGTSYSMTLNKVATISDLRRNTVLSRQLMVGDMNGDGKTDLLLSPYASYYNNYYTYVPVTRHHYCPYCGHENPQGDFCSECLSWLEPSEYCYDCGSRLNMWGGCNGNWDSYEPCCPIHGTQVYAYISEYIDNGKTWTSYLSKGKNLLGEFMKTTQELFNHGRNYNNSQYSYILQDVNGNGRTDLVRMANGSISIYPANGNGISAVQEPAYAYVNSAAYLIPTIVAKQNYHTHLLAMHNDRLNFLRFTRQDDRERMLSAAVNSLGVVIKSDYARLMDKYYQGDAFYTKEYGASFPYNDFDAPLWATAATQVYHKNNQYGDMRYSYEKAVFHRQGLGFAGMAGFYQTDNISGKTVTQTFDPLRYGIPVKVESPESRTEWTFFTNVAYNKKLNVRPTQQKATDLLTGNVVTTNYTSYDAYNNPLAVNTTYASGISSSQAMTYQNTDNTSLYRIGLPTQVTTTHTRNGSSWTEKTVVAYTGAGLPDTRTGYRNNLQTSWEKFGYDTEGNPTSHKTKAYSSSVELETTYGYDSNKRLLKTETDPMGLTTTYYYDSHGKVTSSKDYLNNTTSYEYDALDRQKKVISPAGIGVTSETAFNWNDTNNGSVLSVTQTATDRPTQITYSDAFGRTTRESMVGFNGTQIYTDHLYDDRGRLWKKSDPFISGTPRYTVYTYDQYDRVTKVTLPSGKQTTTGYNGNSITVTDAGITTTKAYDATGLLVSSTDPAGTISYAYRPDGQPISITAPGSAVTSFEYDDHGRQKKLTDPSAGIIQYQYDSKGQLWKHTNARGQVTEYLYNNYGQPIRRITPEATTVYTYRSSDSKLQDVTTGGTHRIVYTYDGLGRVLTETEALGTAANIKKTYAYQYGRIKTVTYNNMPNAALEYVYNTHGYMYQIKSGSKVIYTMNSRNHLGQPTQYTHGNGAVTTRSYTADGLPGGIYSRKGSTVFQNLSYVFDINKGTLTSRTDVANNSGTEGFLYDGLLRLKEYGNTSLVRNSVNYGNNGNITSKSDAGTLTYDKSARPYQVTGQYDFPAGTSIATRTAVYNSSERPLTIEQNGYKAQFTYDGGDNRTSMTVTQNGQPHYTRYYLGGNYEKEVQGSTAKERLYLGGTPYNAPAVAIRTNNGSWNYHYIHRDYLGNITAVSNDAATPTFESYSYDAWGRTRNQATHEPEATAMILNRGYTGHEHLPEFGLINMNARLYDPVLGRFLSPDPFVQAPDYSQNFNRYSYALNNPLMYTDPSGEKWWKWLLGVSAVLDPISAITTATVAGGTAVTTLGTTAAVVGGTVGATAIAGFATADGMTGGMLSGAALTFFPFSNTAYEIQKLISPIAFKPSFMFGSLQNGIGFDFSMGMGKLTRVHGGASYYWSSYGGYNGWETRIGGEVGLTQNLSYSVTKFTAGQYSQTIAKMTLGGPLVNVSYENDYMFFFPGPDGGDRWRTAAVGINFGPMSINLNMFSGDPDVNSIGDRYDHLGELENGKEYYTGNTANDANMRAGVLSFGFGPIRFGRNSEQIRHVFQNKFAHDLLMGGESKWFLKLPIAPTWFWSFGFGSGNTLW